MSDPQRYLLLDANVTAGYYMPSSLGKMDRAKERIRIIVRSVDSRGRTDIKLLIPNLCVAEVFNVFSKKTFDV